MLFSNTKPGGTKMKFLLTSAVQRPGFPSCHVQCGSHYLALGCASLGGGGVVLVLSFAILALRGRGICSTSSRTCTSQAGAPSTLCSAT